MKSELTAKAELVEVLSMERSKSAVLEETVTSLKIQVEQLTSKVKDLLGQLESQNKLKEESLKGQMSLQDVKREKEEWESELVQTQWQLVQVGSNYKASLFSFTFSFV